MKIIGNVYFGCPVRIRTPTETITGEWECLNPDGRYHVYVPGTDAQHMDTYRFFKPEDDVVVEAVRKAA